MTQFHTATHGSDSRMAKTFRLDKALIPIVKTVAKQSHVQQSDVVNTALYQLKEIKQELQKRNTQDDRED